MDRSRSVQKLYLIVPKTNYCLAKAEAEGHLRGLWGAFGRAEHKHFSRRVQSFSLEQ